MLFVTYNVISIEHILFYVWCSYANELRLMCYASFAKPCVAEMDVDEIVFLFFYILHCWSLTYKDLNPPPSPVSSSITLALCLGVFFHPYFSKCLNFMYCFISILCFLFSFTINNAHNTNLNILLDVNIFVKLSRHLPVSHYLMHSPRNRKQKGKICCNNPLFKVEP